MSRFPYWGCSCPELRVNISLLGQDAFIRTSVVPPTLLPDRNSLPRERFGPLTHGG
jgi:hypothetical protein